MSGSYCCMHRFLLKVAVCHTGAFASAQKTHLKYVYLESQYVNNNRDTKGNIQTTENMMLTARKYNEDGNSSRNNSQIFKLHSIVGGNINKTSITATQSSKSIKNDTKIKTEQQLKPKQK